MPQQLANLTLAGVEDFVPVIAPVLIPIFGLYGIPRYPTKPVSIAAQVATVSICSYLQGSPPMGYEFAARDLLSSEVPQAYTTIKTEQQLEENMMGVIRACTRKASILHREYNPVHWYNAPLDLDREPFRFPWPTDLLRKINNFRLRAGSHVRSNYAFKFIEIPNRYWKEPVALEPVDRNIWTTNCNTWILRVYINGLKQLRKYDGVICPTA